MSHQHRFVRADHFDPDPYTRSQIAEGNLNSAILRAEISRSLVGRDESCDQVTCARPPSQNPPSRFSATGSPGCSR